MWDRRPPKETQDRMGSMSSVSDLPSESLLNQVQHGAGGHMRVRGGKRDRVSRDPVF